MSYVCRECKEELRLIQGIESCQSTNENYVIFKCEKHGIVSISKKYYIHRANHYYRGHDYSLTLFVKCDKDELVEENKSDKENNSIEWNSTISTILFVIFMILGFINFVNNLYNFLIG